MGPTGSCRGEGAPHHQHCARGSHPVRFANHPPNKWEGAPTATSVPYPPRVARSGGAAPPISSNSFIVVVQLRIVID